MLRSYENVMKKIPNAPEPYPINETKLRAFLEFYRSQHPQTTYSYLKSFVTAIVFYLRNNNLDDFTKTNNFKSYMLGLKRIMKGDTSPNASKYVTIQLMIELAKNTNQNVKNEIELMTIESLCFYGFLRISEACRLMWKEITYDQDGRLVLLIPYSKTYQTGRRVNVYICRSNTIYSPFVWLPKWKAINFTNEDSKAFTICDRTVRRRFKLQLKKIGVNPEYYSTHSFRKGAAHEASMAGIADCKIKAQGRWISSCYQRYTSIEMVEAGDAITVNI